MTVDYAVELTVEPPVGGPDRLLPLLDTWPTSVLIGDPCGPRIRFAITAPDPLVAVIMARQRLLEAADLQLVPELTVTALHAGALE